MPKKMIIRKSNDLIVAKYVLSLPEMRIIQYMTALIGRDDQDFQAYEIAVADFCSFTGVRKDHFYSEFAQICDSLLKKRVDIHFGADVIYTCWMSSARYCHDEGKIQLKFAPELKPVLLNLKRCFTMYDLRNTRTLRSYYSIRIYEMLKQYEKLKQRVFSLEELKSILCVEDKYAAYGVFRVYILQPAQKELKEKCDIYFDFEEQKTGRKVTRLLFKIYPNEQNYVIDGEYTEIKACPVKPLLEIEDKQDKPMPAEENQSNPIAPIPLWPPLPSEDRQDEPMPAEENQFNPIVPILLLPPLPSEDRQDKPILPEPPLPPPPGQIAELTETQRDILRQLSFIEENLPVQSLVSIYKAANGDTDLIRRRYARLGESGAKDVTSWMIAAVRRSDEQYQSTPKAAAAREEPRSNRFHNFEERVYNYDELEDMALEQFKKAVRQ